MKTKEKQYQVMLDQYKELGPVTLGPMASYIWRTNPKQLVIQMARYKVCAKLLAGKKSVLEIGCGDGFGAPIIGQTVGYLVCTDWDKVLIRDNEKRLYYPSNVAFSVLDITRMADQGAFDAIFSLDVIEHIKPELEVEFMRNSLISLKKDGILIIGTPNIEAAKYSQPQSKAGHVNLKSYQDLQTLLSKYFKNHFLFSMNDEIVHTGFYQMAHYFIGVGIGKEIIRRMA